VVRFFVAYGLARNKTGSVKDGITELYKTDNNKKHTYKRKIRLGILEIIKL
jgi:hypothetical protein